MSRLVCDLPPQTSAKRSRLVDPLGPLEAVIMKVLRSRSTGTAVEITRVLNRHRPHQLSTKTVLTCLTRLEVKGLVTHRKEGRAFRFSPTLTEDEVNARHIGDEITEILDRFGDTAVAIFVERIGPDPDRRQFLLRLLEAQDERGHT